MNEYKYENEKQWLRGVKCERNIQTISFRIKKHKSHFAAA